MNICYVHFQGQLFDPEVLPEFLPEVCFCIHPHTHIRWGGRGGGGGVGGGGKEG